MKKLQLLVNLLVINSFKQHEINVANLKTA